MLYSIITRGLSTAVILTKDLRILAFDVVGEVPGFLF